MHLRSSAPSGSRWKKSFSCRNVTFCLIVVMPLALSSTVNLTSTPGALPGLSDSSRSPNISQGSDVSSSGVPAPEGTAMGAGMCRDRLGSFPPTTFRLLACGMCFSFVYNGKVMDLAFSLRHLQMVFFNSSGVPVELVSPDTDNATTAERVCAEVRRAGEECSRWMECCQAAEQCCQRQLSLGPVVSREGETGHREVGGNASGESGKRQLCPRTWDGFSCWDDTTAGSVVSKSCPAYIQQSFPEEYATKHCWENGSWFVNPESSQEWTDYTSCVQLDNFRALFWVSVVCNVFSLVLLLPACFIFLYFRSLRHQHRIKLHLCLFTSYIFTNTVMLLWELLVFSDRLYNDTHETVIHKNSVGCRFLFAVTRYAWTTNFLWMWLEGFHLFRLMVQAFAVPRSLIGFYIGGFSSPLVPVLAYVIIRASKPDLNTRCWVLHAGAIEWIIYVPILFCIAGNLFFMGKILWVMLNQLQSHPNEPSSYRRAVKAAAILVPLFGLQALMVMIRPSPSSFAFEVISKIVTNTQGAAVAVGFCYLNGEVLTVVKNVLPDSLRSRVLLRSDQRSSVSTQFTTDAVSRSGYVQNSLATRAGLAGSGDASTSFRGQHAAGYIPLSTMSDETRERANEEAKLGNGIL